MFLDKFKYLMPFREARLHTIIHASMFEAGTVGILTAQIPGDRFIIGAVQINMIIMIASEFGESLDKSAALGLLSSQIATFMGLEIANGVIKYLPGIGNITNAVTAGSITETLGWATVKYYKNR